MSERIRAADILHTAPLYTGPLASPRGDFPCPICGIGCQSHDEALACCQPPPLTHEDWFERARYLRSKGFLANEIAVSMGVKFADIVSTVKAVDASLMLELRMTHYHLEKWRHDRRRETLQDSPRGAISPRDDL